jgi:hypothetical protein
MTGRRRGGLGVDGARRDVIDVLGAHQRPALRRGR